MCWPPCRAGLTAAQANTKGVACVILDALTRRRWVKEDDLAADLGLHPKQLRKTLAYLEEDQLVLRDTVRETPRDVAAVQAAAGRAPGEEPPPVSSRMYYVRVPRAGRRPA